ncbi:MAG: hypothetical protein ACLT14_00640 [Butyricicoccaceae bacterium]|jgi:hypothetical protein
MKYNLRCLICRGFKDCISKYIFVIVFSALLLVIARHTTVPVQNILYNISSSLFALPIIFICYDVYQIIITRKQRKMVTIQINDKIEELFTDFIFMTAKFRTDFDSATVASPDFLDLRNSTSNQIFQDISSTEHYGFFIFSYFDDLCQEINKILDSPLFLLYSPNEIISLISEFSMEYQTFLNEFKFISRDDFILIGSCNNLTFEIEEKAQGDHVIYRIQQNRDDKNYVLYQASYPLFDEQMLKGIYRISGTKSKILSAHIVKLYSIIKRWEKECDFSLHTDQFFVIAGRPAQEPYINLYAKDNFSINVFWP